MIETIRILFVGNEQPLRDTFKRLFVGRGWEVITAANGEAALESLAKVACDAILLGLERSVIEEGKILETICERYPTIPVIVATDHGTVEGAVTCMKKGAYDFITKPFEADSILPAIKRALEKRKLEQKNQEFQNEIMWALFDLNTERERLKTIIHCMANGVMVTNKDLEVVLHNPALLRLMGISEEIKNPFPVSRIIKDDSLIKTIKMFQSANSTENKPVSQEILAGNHVLRAISAPALGPDRNVFWTVVGTVTVLEDITVFKQHDRMKTDFMNMVAHELRSPLVSIRQLNSVLSDGLAGPLQEKQQDFISRVTKKIDTLLELINDLLHVAKIEAGKFIQHKEPTDLGKIIEESVALIKQRAEEHHILLSYSCRNLSPIVTDPKSMEEIMNNLLTNAINYSPEGGKVTVIAQGGDGHMEIEVQDTGVGIPPEELPKIFDSFYRVKHPKTRHVTGTGLGLSIVKGIVEANHGTIHVKSVLGQGTTFRILLPVSDDQSTQEFVPLSQAEK